jgi:Ca-activated chloride channel family protein
MKKQATKIIFAFVLLSAMLVSAACSASYEAMDGYYTNGSPLAGEMLGENGETYTEIIENKFVLTAEQDSSYFSIDANTAAYPNLRSLIKNGYSIPKDAVRVEEMLNYFDYDYATPEDGSVLALTSSVFDTPYNSQTKLLTIGLAAQAVEFTSVKNNLVFLINQCYNQISQHNKEAIL